MKALNAALTLSPTDLANHLACSHLTALDLAVATGQIVAPKLGAPITEALRARGIAHETAYVEHLRALGLGVLDLREQPIGPAGCDATREAMASGSDIIVQAPLVSGTWVGRADILRRVERPSDLGAWSYEPIDTKLSAETKGGTILQLCTYAEMLETMQGAAPEFFHVVTPGEPFTTDTYRLDDFRAYYRLVRARLDASTRGAPGPPTYPDPVPHCDICRWWQQCDGRRRADDHLSLVAGIRKTQIGQLARWDVTTLAGFGTHPVPFAERPARGSVESLMRAREQARIQLEGRTRGEVLHETLGVEPGLGLCRLPAPSPGDIFFDLEGDPFVGQQGREYLFGNAGRDDAGIWQYTGQWALNAAQERAAFEAFVDFVTERLPTHPDLHVYHYAPYEPSAMKRLMGLYGTRQEEVDQLLRGEVLIDLYAIVRQSVRASVERYSIKNLEPLYRFERQVPLRDASSHLRAAELLLETGSAELPEKTRTTIEGYNRDDCVSAGELRDWLETVRQGLIDQGLEIPRPQPAPAAPSEALTARRLEVQAVTNRLLVGVPDDPSARNPEQQGRFVLAHLLDFHRREEKSVWWEFFRLADLPEEDCYDEPQALAGLAFVERVGQSKRGVPTDRYSFPPQECDIREADVFTSKEAKFGTVVAVNRDARTIDIQKLKKRADDHPTCLFAHNRVDATVLCDSLMRLGARVADHGLADPGEMHRSARDLLLREVPRLSAGQTWASLPDETVVDRGKRLGLALDHSVLPVQGPPGSGKTYLGARTICELVSKGRRVAITAPSHKVIRKLLDEVLKAADEAGVDVRCIQKVSEGDEEDHARIRIVTKNETVIDALRSGEANVGAGTAWLWAREASQDAADVLFVDEAAQMSLANTLACAQAASSLVLLGDPQQLEQPIQGCHPEGTAVSALHHVLGGLRTVRDSHGLFLPETWRLHPGICAFTSEVFYDSRLSARPGLERQALVGTSLLTGSGLWFYPVAHEGNQNSSPEEVEAIAGIVGRLLTTMWIDKDGVRAPLRPDDILIVAPYNSHVYAIRERLPWARVGTVDRFQGQEAPVVVYSMATSSPEEAPRGMEFLYSLNRLNVATSRARCAAILVASPRLFEPDCRSPRQMRLANAFCRYRELAVTYVFDGA